MLKLLEWSQVGKHVIFNLLDSIVLFYGKKFLWNKQKLKE